MLQGLLGKWLNTVAYQKSQCEKQLDLIEQLSADLRSASKGIVPTSASLYNFLTSIYQPFVLRDYSLLQGVEVRTYTPNSMSLAAFVGELGDFVEARYTATYKRMPDHFTIANRLFGDWYDGDVEINQVMMEFMPVALEMFLFYQEGYASEMNDDLYQKKLVRMKSLEKRYPGLPDFVQHPDYRALVSEILNILTALYIINLRSLGEI